MKWLVYFLIITILSCSQGDNNPITNTIEVSNLAPRLDFNGDTVDLHDGRVIQFGDQFYWYGTTYGETSGFTRSNHYRCYKSSDLKTWEKVGRLLENQPSGVYYRPHVIYNPKTKMYVLWYNWYPKLWNGKFGVATSNSPEGPFKIVNDDVEVAHSEMGVGDHNLFVDEDGTAYLSYNTIEGHRLSVERLSEDYLSSTTDNGGFITNNCEAGSIFKRDNRYYLLTDYTCCFCTQGSGARVYTSDNPLKGYVLQNNINRYQDSIITNPMLSPNQYYEISRSEAGTFEPISFSFNNKMEQIEVFQFTGNRMGTCGDTVATHTHDPIAEFQLQLVMNGDTLHPLGFVEKTSFYNKYTFENHTGNKDYQLLINDNYRYSIVRINQIRGKSGDGLFAPIASTLNAQPTLNRPIIPAQQTHIMELNYNDSIYYIWMGDMWGSAPDNVKGHDQQYWSSPLVFENDGSIQSMKWQSKWELQ